MHISLLTILVRAILDWTRRRNCISWFNCENRFHMLGAGHGPPVENSRHVKCKMLLCRAHAILSPAYAWFNWNFGTILHIKLKYNEIDLVCFWIHCVTAINLAEITFSNFSSKGLNYLYAVYHALSVKG